MSKIDLNKLFSGDRRSLAKAITLVESQRVEDKKAANEILEQVQKKSGNSRRIGISGVPGVGKSTFIEAFGLHLIGQGKKVAVLAVDPSSPLNGGSIMGDKTRMEELSQNEMAFIRPSPTSGALGGVAHKTRETMILCEAAGYDTILIETVGVGQSEYDVASMVDFFLLLMLPGGGDDIQGIKRGILELADAIIINKDDGDSKKMATQTQSYYENALSLLSPKSFWLPPVMKCSSLENKKIKDVSTKIDHFFIQAKDNNFLKEKRAKQNKEWLKRLIYQLLEQRLQTSDSAQSRWQELNEKVISGDKTPMAAAAEIIDSLKL